MSAQLHNNEISMSTELVRQLVNTQFPEFESLAITELPASGSTNRLFRLGEDLLIRMPRQPGGGDGILKEHRWLPYVSEFLPVDTPSLVAIGEPGHAFPETWAIVRWIPGELAAACTSPTPDTRLLAVDLADFILALRSIDVSDAARADARLRWYRGRPLAEFDGQMQKNLAACRRIPDLELDLDAVASLWQEALRLPGADAVTDDRWFHSDLVAENLLVTGGRLTGVLDFGSLSIGDPTIDLHGAWEVLDPAAREIFRDRLNIDDSEWLRGRAWALAIALGCFSYYWDTMPGRRQDRLVMARSTLADSTN